MREARIHRALRQERRGVGHNFGGTHTMLLYELFMLWMIVSIAAVVVSMVFGGLLCVWCAFIGNRRARLLSTSVGQLNLSSK